MSIYDDLLPNYGGNATEDEDKKKYGIYSDLVVPKKPSQVAAEEQKKKPLATRIKNFLFNKQEGLPSKIKNAFTGSPKEENVDEERVVEERGNDFLNLIQQAKLDTESRIKDLETRVKRLNKYPSPRVGLGQSSSLDFIMNKDLYQKQSLAIEEAKKAYERDTGLKAEDSILYKELTEKNKEQLKAAEKDNPNVQLSMEKDALEMYDKFLENSVSDRGFINSLLQEVKDPINLVPFVKDVAELGEAISKYRVIKKYERGEELDPNQMALLNKMRSETLKTYIKKGIGDQAGTVVAQMPKYAMEFLITGGLYSLGRAGAMSVLGKVGASALEKEALKAGGKEAVKFTMKEQVTRLMASLIGSAIQTTGFVPTIANKTAEYMLPEYDLVTSPEAELTLRKLDEGDGFVKALTKAGLVTYVELATERSGVLLEDGASFMKKAIIGKYMAKMGIRDAKTFSKIAEKIGWNGIIGEVFEEELAESIQAPIEGRNYKPALLTPEGTERLWVETLGIGAFGGIGNVIGVLTNPKTGKVLDGVKQKGDIIDISDLPAELKKETEAQVKKVDLTEKAILEKAGKWKDGSLKEKFDKALWNKRTDEVREMLPEVPQDYKESFKDRIEALGLKVEGTKRTETAKKKSVVEQISTIKMAKIPPKPLLPKDKMPVGTGEITPSRFAERLQEQLLDDDPARYEFEGGTGKYNVLNLENDAKKAVKYLQENPREAVAVGLGLMDAPAGQTTNAIAIATGLKAKEEGNFKLYAEIMNTTSLRSTRLGQEIVSLRGHFNQDSAENFVKQVIEARMDKLGSKLVSAVESLSRKISYKAAVNKKIDTEVQRVKSKISAEQTKVRLAQDIIDALRC